MAHIEWVERRLKNWARWSAERESASLGYPRATAFARAAGAPRHSEARNSIPVDGIEADETERAVRALRRVKGVLHAVVVLHYVRGMDGSELAAAMGRITIKRAYQLVEEAHFELVPLIREAKPRITGIAAGQ
jgi:DNA-directed RNA polymerase specialized sigma24 family protein